MNKIVALVIVFAAAIVAFLIYNDSRYDNYGGEQCPKCKSNNIGKYFYGLYRPMNENSYTTLRVKKGELVPGGCVADSRSPKYRCNDCYFTWGKFLNE